MLISPSAASQIKYIEISGHRMVYHTTGGEVNAYGNLKEAANSRCARPPRWPAAF